MSRSASAPDKFKTKFKKDSKRLVAVNIGLAEGQLAALKTAVAQYQELAKLNASGIDALGSNLSQGDTLSGKAGINIDEGLQKQLDFLRSGGQASPEQEANIRKIADEALTRGRSDLNANFETGLQTLRQDLAPSLGLRASDSPIIDRGGNILKENIRQYGQLESNVRGQESQQLLDYPLKSQEVSQAALNFQAKLRQQAAANRLALTGVSGQMGLGLSAVYNAPAGLESVSRGDYSVGGNASTGGSAASTAAIISSIGTLASGAGSASQGASSWQ